MVRPVYKTYTPSNANLTGFASDVTGSSWTLSANSASDGLAHTVSLQNNTANDHSSQTVTFVGTDQDGATQSQTISMPGPSTTVYTTLYFKTLITATPSASIGADTMNIGYTDQFSSQTFPLDVRGAQAYIGVNVSGTINYSVQYTGDDIQGTATRPYNWQEDTGTSIVNVSASGAETFTSIPIATRLIVNSYSPGAIARFTISQMNPQSN